MKMSEKKRQELYDAMSDRIMQLRIDIKQGNIVDIDGALFKLEIDIWQRVKKVLNIKDAADGE